MQKYEKPSTRIQAWMPDPTSNVSDGIPKQFEYIGTNTRYRLTKLGEQMARLPIDPKIARILLAAKKHDCMAEILVIASALSIQDPRELPLEARDAAPRRMNALPTSNPISLPT